jgi:low affinity Fe/Cu permease
MGRRSSATGHLKRARFARFARWTARTVGHTSTFAAALALVAVWAATGPYFHYSDTWQLVINTGTTVITFLMVFVIQQTQNQDSEAMHVKLDEIIRALRGARNDLLDIEGLTEEELDELRSHYAVLARTARRRKRDRHAPRIAEGNR